MSQEDTHCAVVGSWWVVGRAGTRGVGGSGVWRIPTLPSSSLPAPLSTLSPQVPARLLETIHPPDPSPLLPPSVLMKVLFSPALRLGS